MRRGGFPRHGGQCDGDHHHGPRTIRPGRGSGSRRVAGRTGRRSSPTDGQPRHWVFEETLKTRYSRRTITLPAFAQVAIAERITEKGGLLWHQANGEPLFHYVCQHELDRITKEAGIPRLTLHGLRHTQATVLAHLGVAPQIIQRRLGHSKIGTTMDIYAHEMPGEDASAAAMLEQIFGKDTKH